MQINVNGQSYSRWEDVPADVRQQLAATLPDADRNGIPDLIEGKIPGLSDLSQMSQLSAGTQAFTSISVDGQTVNGVGELPAEVQQVLRQAFGWPAAASTPAASAPSAAGAGPLQPGQVMLNGVPTTPGDVVEPKKSWWRRLFGG